MFASYHTEHTGVEPVDGRACMHAARAAFDTTNAAHAAVLDREPALYVSYSQEGAGAWLTRLPDISPPSSPAGLH